MQVIPVINCSDFQSVKKRLAQAEEIGSEWVHIDISDGKFSPNKTWNNPKELTTNRQFLTSNMDVEVHLMVENPEAAAEEWWDSGIKRLIIHLEAIHNKERKFSAILEKCAENSVELMLAINPETPAEELFPFLDALFFVQILAVKPGFSGQKFDVNSIEKIKLLRERAPDIEIEVDGGMNPATARLVRDAGADIITSASYIFESENMKEAYENLKMAIMPVYEEQ